MAAGSVDNLRLFFFKNMGHGVFDPPAAPLSLYADAVRALDRWYAAGTEPGLRRRTTDGRWRPLSSFCHSADDQVVLSGTDFIGKFGFLPVGTFYSPNLTSGGNISDWSDGEVIGPSARGCTKTAVPCW